MMFMNYFKMAMGAITSAKWRSFLTMLGVLIGVLSVVTIVSLGEGVKQQIARQINQSGPDLVTVRPGELLERNDDGDIIDVNYLNVIGSGSLSKSDLKIISETKAIEENVPFGLMNGVPEYADRSMQNVLIVGTKPDMPSVVAPKVQYGNFFTARESTTPVAVIGQDVAIDLFEEYVPIGKTFTLRGKEVMVRGIMEEFQNNPLSPGFNYNRAIFLPYEFAENVNEGELQNYQVLTRPKEDSSVDQLVAQLRDRLQKAHGGQQDFTVLEASDNLAIASNALNLMTAMVAGIAAISLLVGGIGIMNIMLVAVSERTQEIGVRKSVGATSYQILIQFFIEAVVLSSIGGLLGIFASLGANYFIRLLSELEPALDVTIIAIAFAVAVLVGSIFGLMPAIKAARKDPIVSLRRN